MAKDFIETLEEGLRKSRTQTISKEDFKKEQESERKELEKKAEIAKQEALNKSTSITDEKKQDLVDNLQKNVANLDVSKFKELMDKFKINFKDISTISDEAYMELKELL